jgi:hypothetical protein
MSQEGPLGSTLALQNSIKLQGIEDPENGGSSVLFSSRRDDAQADHSKSICYCI